MNRCPNCPQVPVVSLSLANAVLKHIPEVERIPAVQAAFQWLTARHEGLSLYVGINGRYYTREEKDAIALETQAVAETPCPFFASSGCMIHGLGPHYNRIEETGKAAYSWLPTLMARGWALDEYRVLVKAKAIADAKIALLTRNEGFVSKDKETGKIYVG